MGYAAEPFNSFLALLLMTIAAWLTIQIFTDISKKHFLYVLLVTVSTTTCCYLSYRFQSPSFGMATLLPAIAAYLLSQVYETRRENWLVNALATLLVVATLALYQANLGIFCVLVVFLFMKYILEEKLEYGLKFLIKSILIGLASCVIYKIIWDLCLKIRRIGVSNYNGADSSFSEILLNIPAGINHAYSNWCWRRALQDSNYIFEPIRLLIYILILGLFILIGIKVLKGNLKTRLCFFAALLLIPMATNIVFLLTPGAPYLSMQMTGPLLFSGLIALCFVDVYTFNLKKLLTVLVALLLYGNIYCVGTDEDAMIQGLKSMEAIMAQVVSSLEKMDALDTSKEYVIYGDPSKSKLFKKNELWDKASPYAQAGDIWPNIVCTRGTYTGLLNHLGIQLNIADNETYIMHLNSKELADMPTYPSKGSIVVHGNEVLIKISNEYKVENEDE